MRGIDKDLPNTGNAHSMASGATKLKTLRAVLCSVLSFCKAALVGVCTSRDYESVTKLLGTLPAGQARAVLLNCEQTPAYLPYELLRLVQRHANGIPALLPRLRGTALRVPRLREALDT